MAPSMKKIWISHLVGPFMYLYMEFQKSDSFLLNFCNLLYIAVLSLGNFVCPPQGLVKILFIPRLITLKTTTGTREECQIFVLSVEG